MQDKDQKFWDTITYFKYTEFDSPDDILSGQKMNHDFVKLLDCIRHIAGIPFIVSSGYRTIKHNTKKRGEINSAHLRGLAADISAEESFTKWQIIKTCLSTGVVRLGIYEKHIHIDNDLTLPYPNIWYGKPEE